MHVRRSLTFWPRLQQEYKPILNNTDRTRRVRKKKPHRLRFRLLLALGILVGLFVLFVLVDSAAYYNKVHAGVNISGHPMGGRTRDQAVAELNRLVEQASANPIVLVAERRSWNVMPANVGAKIDVASTVEAAMGFTRDHNFFADLWRRLKLYFADVDVPVKGSLDSQKLDDLIAQIAKELDQPPVNAGLKIEGGEIKVVPHKAGKIVDRQKLRQELTSLVLTLHSTELEIPMKMVEPTIKAEDTKQAIEEAKIMISAPVYLRLDDLTWTLSIAQIIAAMAFSSEDVNGVPTLIPFISAEKLSDFFAEVSEEVAIEPVNATFRTDGERAYVVPSVEGRQLDATLTALAITEAAKRTSDRVATVVTKPVEPDLTTAEAEAMGIKEKLASYTTEWVGTEDRQVNVRVTTKYASDVILAPGEEYNFDKQIGPRTPERGFRKAPGIVGPGKLEDVYGGGICQVSTTLFNAAFFAGLKITERHNHSIYIDHYPKGRDATVSANGPNLRFVNDTAHHILIRGKSDGITTTFTIYGTKDGRTVTYTTSDFYNIVPMTTQTTLNPTLPAGKSTIKIPGQEGKQCKVVRVVKAADGTILHKDTFISTYPMIPRIIEYGPSTTTTTNTTTSSTLSSTTTTTH